MRGFLHIRFPKICFIIAFLAHAQSVKSIRVQLGVRKGLCFPILVPAHTSMPLHSLAFIWSALHICSWFLAFAFVLRIRMA